MDRRNPKEPYDILGGLVRVGSVHSGEQMGATGSFGCLQVYHGDRQIHSGPFGPFPFVQGEFSPFRYPGRCKGAFGPFP